jgi:hypothetical protein
MVVVSVKIVKQMEAHFADSFADSSAGCSWTALDLRFRLVPESVLSSKGVTNEY